MSELATDLVDGDLELRLFLPEHISPLREVCAKDAEIWDIYPVNMLDELAESQLAAFHGPEGWVRFAVLHRGVLIGTTSYIAADLPNGTVMIGATYIEPAFRGVGINRRMKVMMIDHAFARGFWRIEFTVDTRNGRSMAAMAKLGATHEGTMRRNRKTWTGYVRDTALYSILVSEWPALRG